MTPLIGAIGPFCLGVACLVLGIRIRRGLGRIRLSPRVGVDYARLPRPVRARASDVDLALGASFLAFAAGSLSPGPVLLVPFVLVLILCYPCYLRHRDLRTAAEAVAGADPAG